MMGQLTQADVARLLSNPAADVRAEVAGKLGVEIDNPRLTDKELELAQDIIRVLAKDVAVSVRESLAFSLRKAQRLPHDVALQLAKDVEQVSLPILEDCLILSDSDLLSIIAAGSEAKQNAIAKRPEVLLCDEPTGALDSRTGIRVLEALALINEELGTTTAIITHNAAVKDMAHRVLMFGDGRITESLTNSERKPPSAISW